jgi:uncharacterized membrane protein YidH (DUF202 family)
MSSAIPEDEQTPGLAGQRTDLAWSRSGLAVVTCLAAIAKKLLPELSTISASALVVILLAIGGLAWIVALLWARAIAAQTLAGRQTADHRTLRAVAYGTTALAVASIVIALVPS